MKHIIAISVLIVFLTPLAASGTDQSVLLTDSELSQLKGTGWCGFFDGLRTGLATSGAIAAFVPGAQGYAVGAGLAVALISVGTGLAC